MKYLLLLFLCLQICVGQVISTIVMSVNCSFVFTGAGIYNIYSSTLLPNNSIISTNTVYSSWRSIRRVDFYCCSNSTSGSIGTFIGLNGNSYSGRFTVRRYSSSDSYAGCIEIYWRSSSTQSPSEEGIYTCRMPDSAGRNIDVNVGIYRQNYNSKFPCCSLQVWHQ